MNEEGVSIGEIDSVILDFNSIYMEFPIEEYKSDKRTFMVGRVFPMGRPQNQWRVY